MTRTSRSFLLSLPVKSEPTRTVILFITFFGPDYLITIFSHYIQGWVRYFLKCICYFLYTILFKMYLLLFRYDTFQHVSRYFLDTSKNVSRYPCRYFCMFRHTCTVYMTGCTIKMTSKFAMKVFF